MPAQRTMRDKAYHTRHVLTVDRDAFKAEFAKRSAVTDEQIGELVHTHPRTIRRIRTGEVQPSTGFQANCLAVGINFAAFVSFKRADELKTVAA